MHFSFNSGDFVVHPKHGVGRFAGLFELTIENVKNEFAKIEYALSSSIFIPVFQIGILKFHSFKDSTTQIDILNKPKTFQRKQKLLVDLQSIAKELAQIAAIREKKIVPSFSVPDSYSSFDSDFEFSLTPCQKHAISEIFVDLAKSRPMDRLLCADIGFGKTEVALRAAFVVNSGKKAVLFIVPTTILASQHFDLVKSRFEKYGINVALLCRFLSKKDQESVRSDWLAGKIDFLITTASHRGIAKLFHPNIGLLILDEEHHFGAKFKEDLRNIGHLLQLSATPIPRTLNLALSKLKDISTLETPPTGRKNIKIHIVNESEFDLHEIIESELAFRSSLNQSARIFIVVPRIEFLPRIQQMLGEIEYVVIHGQMGSAAMESALSDFKSGKKCVLLGTHIIESGLNVIEANLIIVFHAQMFGVAQLHQLKGRVGRGNLAANAYFVVSNKVESENTRARLDLLAESDFLGAGMHLALSDMHVRGSGTVIGNRQSGCDYGLGIETYYSLLAEALGEIPTTQILEAGIQFDGFVNSFIPKTYIQDERFRIDFYKELSLIRNEASLIRLKEIFIARFGSLPSELLNLLEIVELQFLAFELGVKKISKKIDVNEVTFENLTPQLIVALSEFSPLFKGSVVSFSKKFPFQIFFQKLHNSLQIST